MSFRNTGEPIDMEPSINYAIDRIYKDYGDRVSVYQKGKQLLKFGRNTSVTTSESTIWHTGKYAANETYAADNTNPIDTISSNSADDTEVVSIEGHTMTGGNKTFVVQTATLQGQDKVTLNTPLNRCTRVAHNGGSATNLVGEVYVYEDDDLTAGKPDTAAKIHLTVRAGQNQSEKASTSLSSVDYWIVTGFRASVLTKASAFADVTLQVRLSGGVFRPQEDVACSNAHNGVIVFHPYLVIPKNADVRLVGKSDAAGGRDISGSIYGYLAKITD